jgi:tRNA 2-thiouridine synthesizing protein A
MSPGERLRVVTTDPVSVIDIPHFCHDAGHHLISETEEAGVYCFEIEKGS